MVDSADSLAFICLLERYVLILHKILAMKEFLQILRRFVPPYKGYLVLNIVFNILAAILTLFSFALIIPILQMLFLGDGVEYHFMPWDSGSLKDVVINNFY